MERDDAAYVVISADCHGGADLYGYRDYLDPQYRDDFDAWAASYEIPYEDLKGEEGGRNWDSSRRLADLEADGVAAEVVFPNTVPPFFRTSSLASQLAADAAEVERRWAGLRAHNRWLADFCADAPGRRAGIIQVSLHDIEASVREIAWAASVGLTGGILLPGAPPGSGLPPLYDHEYYAPLWSACEDAGFPVNCHSGGASPRPDDTPLGHVLFLHEMLWWDQRTLRLFILGGVLERHPALHLVFTEAGLSWIPDELRTLEYFCSSMRGGRGSERLSYGEQVVSALSCSPMEYWRRQCHVGASFMHPSDRRFWDRLGTDTIMWGSDYPHTEASFPFSREAITLTFSGAEPESVQAMLGGNAAKLYGFDFDRLSVLAERIGPRRADVAEGLSPADIPPGAAKCPAFAGILAESGRLRWGDNRKVEPVAEAH